MSISGPDFDIQNLGESDYSLVEMLIGNNPVKFIIPNDIDVELSPLNVQIHSVILARNNPGGGFWGLIKDREALESGEIQSLTLEWDPSLNKLEILNFPLRNEKVSYYLEGDNLALSSISSNLPFSVANGITLSPTRYTVLLNSDTDGILEINTDIPPTRIYSDTNFQASRSSSCSYLNEVQPSEGEPLIVNTECLYEIIEPEQPDDRKKARFTISRSRSDSERKEIKTIELPLSLPAYLIEAFLNEPEKLIDYTTDSFIKITGPTDTYS